jgi:hypothetical protein
MSIFPVLLPAMVLIFMPENQKSTAPANILVIGLMMVLLIQPITGMFSGHDNSCWGRRWPILSVLSPQVGLDLRGHVG